MPRGIPNKKKEIMKESLDITAGPSNPASANLLGLGKHEEPKAAPKTDEVEYTVSPDGKYKIPKPKSHGTYIEDKSTRIPYFELPGRVIAWHIDREPNELAHQTRRGWEFVTQDTEDCPYGQELVVWGGSRANGSTYQHYAMSMPVERFKALKDAEQGRIKDHELEQGIYATEQMTLGTKYEHGLLKKE